jgi:DNA (cytosine-5)-methyltransferase 1
MTTFPRLSTTAIGQNKNAPRVWLEGQYLRDAGFNPGCHIQVEFSTDKIVIKLAANGPRIVSSKKQGHVSVVDLNSSAIQTTFGTTVSKLQVHVSPNQIILTPAHSLALRATRCKNGTEGSCFSGGGLLTEAAKQAGYTPAFAIEVDSGYSTIFERNHPEARMFNLSVEDIPLDALPQVELLTLGIPCQPWALCRRRDVETGNKRDRSLPPEAHPLSDMSIWAALLIRQVNPATIVIEEAPGYLNSSAGYMLRLFLERAGYFVHGAVLDPTLYGEITARKRTVIVATSEPGFQWPATSPCTRTFADFADPPEIAESQYFTPEQKPWLFKHWETQTQKGNGFAPPQLSDQSTRVPVVRRRYFSQQGDGVVVKHPTREAYRWLSLAEVRRIHTVPDTYLLDEEQSLTRAGEVIGQGVIISFFQKIISAARHFTSTEGSANTQPHDLSTPSSSAIDPAPNKPSNFNLDQMGLAFT